MVIVPKALTALNILKREKGAFAALLGEAHENIVTGILMRLGFPVSVITVRGGAYDLIIPVYEAYNKDPEKTVLIRAQIKTMKQSLRFIGGTRAGVDRVYLRGVKEYKYTEKHNDLIIGVDQHSLDLYLVPTRYISKWGKSISKNKLQPLKNNWDVLLNWNDAYLRRLDKRL